MKIYRNNFKQYVYPMVVAVIVALLFFMLFVNNVNTVKHDFRSRARSDLDVITDMIEFEMNQELSSVNIIEFFIKELLSVSEEIDETRLTSYVQYILDSHEAIDSITIAPGGIIQYIFPFEGNEMMIGFDILGAETRNVYAARAIELKRAVAQGPVMTAQGKYLVFNRSPIFIEDDGQELFWGFISVSIDFDALMQKYEKQMSDTFTYALYVPMTDSSLDFYWGDVGIFELDYLTEYIHLPELSWKLISYPAKGWYQFVYLDFPYLLIGFILAILVYLHTKNIVLKYQNSKTLAMTDSLTGSISRLGFDQLVNNKAIIEKGSALLVIDVDNFKDINDSFGHKVGDFVLKEMVSIMFSCLRSSDQVFRIGGDEFVIILRGTHDQGQISMIAQRLLVSTRREIRIDDKEVEVSLSIGIAMSKTQGTSISELFKGADEQLYHAKSLGKNQFSM